MDSSDDWISVALLVPNISEAIEVYVRKWRLFRVLLHDGFGIEEYAALEAEGTSVAFRITLAHERQLDFEGNLIANGSSVRISLPKSDFWIWVDDVFGGREVVENVPWSAYVLLKDPFGHVFVVYTTRPPN